LNLFTPVNPIPLRNNILLAGGHTFLKYPVKSKRFMKEVYYKGKSYAYKLVDSKGKRQFQLFEGGSLVKTVDENELDIRSIVSLILDSYYKNMKPSVRSSVLS
jgi:hypothetical protein